MDGEVRIYGTVIPATARRVTLMQDPLYRRGVGLVVPKGCKLRRVKYLNNVIEQDHRFVKKKVRASQCFKTFHTAERTLEGIEALDMMRKGQVKRVAGGDVRGQAEFVESLFGTAA